MLKRISHRFSWLNGIKALRKHAEKSPYFSKYDAINEEGNLAKNVSRFFFDEKEIKINTTQMMN
jgi:hypothetical protein